jgi:hypothetical protein
MKSGKVNFLEPSRALRECNGTALPFRKKIKIASSGYEKQPKKHLENMYEVIRYNIE